MNPSLAARQMLELLGAQNDPGKQTAGGASQEHLLWMLHTVAGWDNTQKAHRWLGYAQGLAVMLGLCTLEQMKELNREAQDTPTEPDGFTGTYLLIRPPSTQEDEGRYFLAGGPYPNLGQAGVAKDASDGYYTHEIFKKVD